MNEIVVFGSLNMDLVVRVREAPRAGETVEARAFLTNPGGKGANQAVACARAGGRVAMIGRIGEDAFGQRLRDALAAEGVDVRDVAAAGPTSGLAVILVDDAAENRIAIVPGANAEIASATADDARDAIARASLLLLQLEVPIDAVARAARIARESGTRVVLNPAPARPLPDALWAAVDLLVVNETEAELLSGCAVRGPDDAARVAAELRARGPDAVIVTLGREGAVVVDAAGARRQPAIAVDPVDTTAAGDTFVGAACARLAAGASLDEAVALAVRAAAVCVTRIGAQAAIPTLAEALAMPAPPPSMPFGSSRPEPADRSISKK